MTTPGYSVAEVTAGMVRAGIARLVGSYPFHARVLERFRLRADPAVVTMGVGLRDDRLELVFSPEFVARVTADELGGVLLHEVLHVVLGHVTADPDSFPDREAKTIAEEVTVNEFVREPLPGQPIVLAMFPNLPPGESTGERYRRLADCVPKKWSARLSLVPVSGPQSSSTGRDAGASVNPSAGEPAGGGGTPDAANPGGTSGEDDGAGGEQPVGRAGQTAGRRDGGGLEVGSNLGRGGEATGGKSRPPASPRPPEPSLVDNHGGWPSTAGQREAFRAALADMITDVAADTPVPPEVAASLRGCGVVPGQGVYVVRGEAKGMDWRTLLRRYVGRELRVEPRYGRPARRFPELAGVVPGRARAEGEVSVVAVVDTSGSMSDRMLEAIAGELRHLGRHYTVHIVESDCAVLLAALADSPSAAAQWRTLSTVVVAAS